MDHSGEDKALDVKALLADTTPAPWWVTDDLDTDDDPAIGIAYGFPSDDGSPYAMVATTPGSASYDAGDPANKEANARLLAAAPDLAAEVLRLRDVLADIHRQATDPTLTMLAAIDLIERLSVPYFGRSDG